MNQPISNKSDSTNFQNGKSKENQIKSLNIDALINAIEHSKNYLLSRQDPDGFWVDELESNTTITAELIFLMHFVGKLNKNTQNKCVQYLLNKQRKDGSWAIYYDAPGCVSTTIESYMAMKMAGISPNHSQMIKSKEFISL